MKRWFALCLPFLVWCAAVADTMSGVVIVVIDDDTVEVSAELVEQGVVWVATAPGAMPI